jgi:hypothetical protein
MFSYPFPYYVFSPGVWIETDDKSGSDLRHILDAARNDRNFAGDSLGDARIFDEQGIQKFQGPAYMSVVILKSLVNDFTTFTPFCFKLDYNNDVRFYLVVDGQLCDPIRDPIDTWVKVLGCLDFPDGKIPFYVNRFTGLHYVKPNNNGHSSNPVAEGIVKQEHA